MKKKFIWIFLILILSLLAWQIIARINQKKSQAGPAGGFRGASAIAVETAPLSLRDLSDTGLFSGTLEARSSFLLAPRVSGQLRKLLVDIGQSVSRGQVVAELDDRVFKLELDKAQAAVAMSQAQAEQAASALSLSEIEFENQRQLYDKGFISKSQYDQAAAQLKSYRSQDSVAKASLNSALAALSAAEIQLSYTKVRADWEDGSNTRIIGEKLADEGALLSSGAPLYRVMDIASLIAVIDVIEKDYTRIRIGQNVLLSTDTFPGQKYEGKVLRKAPMLSETSRQARIEIEIPNRNLELKPGMFARVAVTYATKQKVQAVPVAALYKYSGREGVFHVDKDSLTVKFVPLEIGIRGVDFAEVLAPALEGEVVVLGQDLLSDGSQISLPGAGKEAKEQKPRGRG